MNTTEDDAAFANLPPATGCALRVIHRRNTVTISSKIDTPVFHSELDSLKRQINYLLCSCAALAVLLLLLFISDRGVLSPLRVQAALQSPVQDEVISKKFVLVDDTGKELAILQKNPANGTTIFTMNAPPYGGRISMMVGPKNPTEPVGSAYFSVTSGQGVGAISSSLNFTALPLGATLVVGSSALPGNPQHAFPQIFLKSSNANGAQVEVCGSTNINKPCTYLQQ
jgi:hypothetical protein